MAVSGSEYSQKPYPLGLPVVWSYTSRKVTTVPTCANVSRSCSSVVSYEMLPTKTVDLPRRDMVTGVDDRARSVRGTKKPVIATASGQHKRCGKWSKTRGRAVGWVQSTCRGRACAVARENSRTNQILKGWPGIWFKLRHGQCHVFVVEPKAPSRPLMNATWPTFFLEPLSAADARLWHRYCQP